jgi:hypothetical protein
MPVYRNYRRYNALEAVFTFSSRSQGVSLTLSPRARAMCDGRPGFSHVQFPHAQQPSLQYMYLAQDKHKIDARHDNFQPACNSSSHQLNPGNLVTAGVMSTMFLPPRSRVRGSDTPAGPAARLYVRHMRGQRTLPTECETS